MLEVVQWINKSNNKIDPFPENKEQADFDWFNDHRFVWNPEKLSKFIKKNEPVIILGLCDNLEEIVKYFNDLYCLKVPISLVKKRLLRPDRQKSNAFGRDKRQINQLDNIMEELDEKSFKLGFKQIDATTNEDEILTLFNI